MPLNGDNQIQIERYKLNFSTLFFILVYIEILLDRNVSKIANIYVNILIQDKIILAFTAKSTVYFS